MGLTTSGNFKYNPAVENSSTLYQADSAAQRASEKAVQAEGQMQRLEMIVCAMWEAMKESGVSQELLYDKIDTVLADPSKFFRKSYEPLIINCPKCGKAIQESRKTPLRGKCMFCGQEVTFYPYTDMVAYKDDSENNG
jgi:hypothetical protein